MRDSTIAMHAFLIPLLLATVAACGTTVNERDPDSGAGGASSGSPPGSVASTSGAGASADAGAGAGGTAVLGEPVCQVDEGALVMASSTTSARIAVQYQGQWVADGAILQAASRMATYVDVYHHLGAFWIDPIGGGNSNFMTTFDGSSFEEHDVWGWTPQPVAPVLSPGGSALVGAVDGGTNVAFFDPDASDWHPLVEPISFAASSAARSSSDSMVLIGLGNDGQLCDVSLVGGAWQSIRCLADIEVATGGEIPLTRPQLVALPGGGVVAIYYQTTTTLAAITMHEGTWSSPVTVTSDAIGVAFAAAATPTGDVIAALVDTSGEVSALRYSSSAGWAEPIAVDSGALAQQQLAAATGVCGDDVLFAYVNEAARQVRVARVRGNAAGASTVAEFGDDLPQDVSIVTRLPTDG